VLAPEKRGGERDQGEGGGSLDDRNTLRARIGEEGGQERDDCVRRTSLEENRFGGKGGEVALKRGRKRGHYISSNGFEGGPYIKLREKKPSIKRVSVPFPPPGFYVESRSGLSRGPDRFEKKKKKA